LYASNANASALAAINPSSVWSPAAGTSKRIS